MELVAAAIQRDTLIVQRQNTNRAIFVNTLDCHTNIANVHLGQILVLFIVIEMLVTHPIRIPSLFPTRPITNP